MVLVKTRDELLQWVANKAGQLLRDHVISMPAVTWNGMCVGGVGGGGGGVVVGVLVVSGSVCVVSNQYWYQY